MLIACPWNCSTLPAERMDRFTSFYDNTTVVCVTVDLLEIRGRLWLSVNGKHPRLLVLATYRG